MRALLLCVALAACGGSQPAPAPEPPSVRAAIVDIQRTLDAWHAAAARADEKGYFSFFSDDAVFLGTDATERWRVDEFREYAHPHFAKGKAWSFRAVRREVIVAPGGRIAWFDEDLDTPNLGPARGSGVMVRRGPGWLIAHYNLTITVPNERFKEVKELLAKKPEEPKPEPAPEPQAPLEPR